MEAIRSVPERSAVVAAALSTAGQQLLQMRPDLDQTYARISISTRQAVARQVAAWHGDRSMSQVGNKAQDGAACKCCEPI
jgi:hypothetical protein